MICNIWPFLIVFFIIFVSNTVSINLFYMSLCPYVNVLIPFLRIHRLSSKHDKDLCTSRDMMKQLSLKAFIRHHPPLKHFQSTNLFDRSMIEEIAVQNFSTWQQARKPFTLSGTIKLMMLFVVTRSRIKTITSGEWYTEDRSE